MDGQYFLQTRRSAHSTRPNSRVRSIRMRRMPPTPTPPPERVVPRSLVSQLGSWPHARAWPLRFLDNSVSPCRSFEVLQFRYFFSGSPTAFCAPRTQHHAIAGGNSFFSVIARRSLSLWVRFFLSSQNRTGHPRVRAMPARFFEGFTAAGLPTAASSQRSLVVSPYA